MAFLVLGKWLITSASSNSNMHLSQIKNHDQLKRSFLSGYPVSIIKFQCVTKLETTLMEIRADKFSFHYALIQKLDINLTDPSKHLLSKISQLTSYHAWRPLLRSGINSLRKYKSYCLKLLTTKN